MTERKRECGFKRLKVILAPKVDLWAGGEGGTIVILEPIIQEERRWLGQSVWHFQGNLAGLEDILPTFSRREFTHEHALNEYLDLILRDPVPGDQRTVPIATVSKRYFLIQHRAAVRAVLDSALEMDWEPSEARVQGWMSDYGERLRVEVRLPLEPEILAGDRYDVELMLWNSVDRSRAFEIAIRWRRLVCLNGLFIPESERLRKVHQVDWVSREPVTEFLRECLPQSRQRLRRLESALKSISTDSNEWPEWIDGLASSSWGKLRAVRLLNILRFGRDCAAGRLSAEPASRIRVSSTEDVPGSPRSAKNLYDVYQAMLWLIGRTPSVEQEEELLAAVPHLLSKLNAESAIGMRDFQRSSQASRRSNSAG